MPLSIENTTSFLQCLPMQQRTHWACRCCKTNSKPTMATGWQRSALWALSHCLSLAVGFQMGVAWHMEMEHYGTHSQSLPSHHHSTPQKPVQQQTLEQFTGSNHPAPYNSTTLSELFFDSRQRFVRRMGWVPRNVFLRQLDLWPFPLDAPDSANQDVLLFMSQGALTPSAGATPNNTNNHTHAVVTLDECESLKVVTFQPQTFANRRRNICLAVLGQWETSHVHNYQKRPPVQATSTMSETRQEILPVESQISAMPLWTLENLPYNSGRSLLPYPDTRQRYRTNILLPYWERRAATLARLEPVLRQVAQSSTLATTNHSNNTTHSNGQLVVLVCNQGQIPLLQNFMCHARAHNVSLRHALVFCTDAESFQFVSRTLDLTAFDVQNALGDWTLPSQPAKTPSDKTFGAMVLAKVLIADLVASLSYDFLLQDVDIVWYQDPLPWFAAHAMRHHDANRHNLPPYDLVFQDDGIRSKAAQGLSTNTGCYFARAGLATQNYFASLVGLGENILEQRIDQPFMTGILNEFMHTRGLRVKILSSRHANAQTPTGYHWRRDPDYMKQWFEKSGQADPILFHNNWNAGMVEKIQIFEQLGAWYVHPECLTSNTTSMLEQDCCLVQSITKCHFSRFPSRVPCKRN